jgi:hypothetical protein
MRRLLRRRHLINARLTAEVTPGVAARQAKNETHDVDSGIRARISRDRASPSSAGEYGFDRFAISRGRLETTRLSARSGAGGRYAAGMSSRAGIVVALLFAAVALSSATAGARKHKAAVTVQHSRHLWATVNFCDPAEPPTGIAPNTIGVRASMPGSADGREIMFMRFRLQYLKDADMKWHNVTGAISDSGWTRVGLARYNARQGGRYFFNVVPPAGKPSVLLRGKVNFEWRLRGEVVRRGAKLTSKGHRSSAGAFPAGYSEATCMISA